MNNMNMHNPATCDNDALINMFGEHGYRVDEYSEHEGGGLWSSKCPICGGSILGGEKIDDRDITSLYVCSTCHWWEKTDPKRIVTRSTD